MNRMWLQAIVAAALAAGSVGISATGHPDGLQLFAARVAAYADLHQRVDAVFPPWTPTEDVDGLFRRRAYLAAAIRAERPHARQGDIFDAVVGAEIRGLIAEALSGVDVELLLEGLYEDCEKPAGYRPQVNAKYPVWAVHEVPFVLLRALPPLPPAIQYRFIDHDLLLWDVDADVIVDVLPDALPRAGS